MVTGNLAGTKSPSNLCDRNVLTIFFFIFELSKRVHSQVSKLLKLGWRGHNRPRDTLARHSPARVNSQVQATGIPCTYASLQSVMLVKWSDKTPATLLNFANQAWIRLHSRTKPLMIYIAINFAKAISPLMSINWLKIVCLAIKLYAGFCWLK